MKKALILLLTAALVLSLAACGTKNPTGGENTGNAGDTANNNDGSNDADTGDANANDDADTGDVVEGDTSSDPVDGAGDTDKTDNDAGTNDTGSEDAPDKIPEGTPVKYDVNFAVLTGPTGVGAVSLMEKNDAGETLNSYTVSAVADNSQIQAGLINGDYDIAAVATNVASALYNKTEGQVKVIAINTLGVLYILERGDTIHSVADLAGKTIYSPGQGANPEYALRYILTSNGLTVSTPTETVEGADVSIVFEDASVIQTKMGAGEIDVCMLPVPAATAVLIQNEDVRSALDMTAEWDALGTGGQLTMGCVAVRTQFADENPEAVKQFLTDYEASITTVESDVDHAAQLCETYGIVPKAAIAKRAIPDCSLTFIAGADVRGTLEPYYQVLFDANPASIGGAMPRDDFYWTE